MVRSDHFNKVSIPCRAFSRLFRGTGGMHEGQPWSKLTSNQSAAAAYCKGQSYVYSGGKAA
jgi:hypothetical protein